MSVNGTTATAISSAVRITVYRILGEMKYVRHAQVAATDWLHLCVHEQAFLSDPADGAREALSSITLREESWSSAAERVLLAFRATLADGGSPCIIEATSAS